MEQAQPIQSRRMHYTILQPEDMGPREQIQLVELDPLTEAELHNIKRGIPYKYTVTDSPKNRETLIAKALYFQMVAYKEGVDVRFRIVSGAPHTTGGI